ncbi:MAG: hypothetical protein K8S94_12810 [Planctomycetia bacterium]|nr:hypothetical protein [Planctomycetia bacterium]
MASDPATLSHAHAALRTAVAWKDLPGHGVLLATGRDAVRFVDNFTTAALSRLDVGQGAEGFFTDSRGWVIALASILRTADGLWIDAAPGTAPRLRDHLEHYHIREDVALADASADRASVLIAGPRSADWIAARAAAPVPARLFDHVGILLGGIDVHLARMDWCGPDCFLVQLAATDEHAFRQWLEAEGLPRADAAAFECARIENRYPLPGDIPDKTLPQELDRTARAISFTKGCYLGQETVARLDALGHVNRTLALVAIEGPPPPAGTPVTWGDEVVGTMTSSCPSAAGAGAIGLAILHRKSLAGPLAVQGRVAHVVTRPAAHDAATLRGS